MKEMFTFDDVLIVPKFSAIESSSQVSLYSNIRGLELHGLPIISANMDTVTGDDMSRAMLRAGAQACLHRFGSIQETVLLFKASSLYSAHATITPMVSIGLGSTELERAKALFDVGAHTFVIDVAHGAQMSVVKQVKALREILGPYVNIVVGNFATGESVKTFLEHSGNTVDAFKVGIGPDSAYTTRVKTGVGYPQLSAVVDVVQTLKNTGIPVIADGGMKKAGDVAKALGAGASMVMLGEMLSGTNESPGDVVDKDGNKAVMYHGRYYAHPYTGRELYKKYRGSASLESYKDQDKEAKHRTAEGEAFMVPYKGPVADVLQDVEGGLRSAMTYVGASNLKEFASKVEFVRISGATINENDAHGRRQ